MRILQTMENILLIKIVNITDNNIFIHYEK